MRINVYSEELTDRVVVIEKTAADTGLVFLGLRIYLKSPPELHNTEEDDDTSAVTFWFADFADLIDFRNALIRNAQTTK